MLDESIFKAYDIRGIYSENLDEDVAEDIGRAFVKHLDLSGSRVVVARDMRISGETLEKAFIQGVTQAGADVLDLGLVSTDALYFAVGHLEEPGGAMVTASHNPKDYNGFKLCREEAIALSGDAGLGQIRDLIVSGDLPDPAKYPGSVEETDITVDYAKHCLSFIETEDLRPLKIVIDAGNGMAGKMVPPIFEHLPFEYAPMYFELDGTFPNHPPNPIEPENVRELQERVVAEDADFGVAFDGDADRCFIIDENGTTISGDLARPHSEERAGEGAGRDHTVQRGLLEGLPRARRARGREGHKDQGRPLHHQAADAKTRRGLRRGALSPLLLQGQLLRRLRHHRHADHSRARRPPGRAYLQAPLPHRSLRPLG